MDHNWGTEWVAGSAHLCIQWRHSITSRQGIPLAIPLGMGVHNWRMLQSRTTHKRNQSMKDLVLGNALALSSATSMECQSEARILILHSKSQWDNLQYHWDRGFRTFQPHRQKSHSRSSQYLAFWLGLLLRKTLQLALEWEMGSVPLLAFRQQNKKLVNSSRAGRATE